MTTDPIAPPAHSAFAVAQSSLEAMWENVAAKWDDENAHAAFLEIAAAENNLAFAAARYREVKEVGEPSRARLAEVQLSRLTALAFAQLDASHSPAPQPKKVITLVAFVVSVTLLGACVYAFTL